MSDFEKRPAQAGGRSEGNSGRLRLSGLPNSQRQSVVCECGRRKERTDRACLRCQRIEENFYNPARTVRVGVKARRDDWSDIDAAFDNYLKSKPTEQ